MKFVVSQGALQNELQFLQGIAEKKKTIPILSNILLKAEGSFLTLAASGATAAASFRGSDTTKEGFFGSEAGTFSHASRVARWVSGEAGSARRSETNRPRWAVAFGTSTEAAR